MITHIGAPLRNHALLRHSGRKGAPYVGFAGLVLVVFRDCPKARKDKGHTELTDVQKNL
jgi:hypothetical protein